MSLQAVRHILLSFWFNNIQLLQVDPNSFFEDFFVQQWKLRNISLSSFISIGQSKAGTSGNTGTRLETALEIFDIVTFKPFGKDSRTKWFPFSTLLITCQQEIL